MSGDSRHLMRLGPTEGKGQGLFAAQAIQKGTRLLLESPILAIRIPHDVTAADVKKAFDCLTPDKRQQYLALYASDRRLDRFKEQPEPYRTALAIHENNAFGYDVYFHASRFNHTCVPNLAVSIQKDIIAVYAVRHIRKGEELTISYFGTDSLRTRMERAERLRRWDFICGCQICKESLSSSLSDMRRKQLGEYNSYILRTDSPGNAVDLRQSMRAAQQMTEIMEQEGLTGQELWSCYYYGARYSWALGNKKDALVWARKMEDHMLTCLGADSKKVHEVRNVLLDLEAVNDGLASLSPRCVRWLTSQKVLDEYKLGAETEGEMEDE